MEFGKKEMKRIYTKFRPRIEMNTLVNNRKIKLPHTDIVKAPGLLPMLYTLREIGEELDVPDSTLRDWLQAGAPHQRDTRDHLWINGESFANWVKAQKKPGAHRKLAASEGYCLHCNQITQLVSPEVRHIKGKLIHMNGKCPQCGHIINRGDRYDRTAELSYNQEAPYIP